MLAVTLGNAGKYRVIRHFSQENAENRQKVAAKGQNAKLLVRNLIFTKNAFRTARTTKITILTGSAVMLFRVFCCGFAGWVFRCAMLGVWGAVGCWDVL